MRKINMVSTKIRITQTAQMGPSTIQMPRREGGAVAALSLPVSDAGPLVVEFMMRFLQFPAGSIERPVDGVDAFTHEPGIGL